MTMSVRTTRCGSLMPLLTGWISRRGVRPRCAEGDGPPGICAWGSAEALHLRLPEPCAIEPPAGGRNPPQHRGDLAAATPEAGLQDYCRLSARQPQRLPP